MKLYKYIASILLMFVLNVWADDASLDSSQPKSFEELTSIYSPLGTTFQKTQTNDVTNLEIIFDQDKLLAKIPDLQQLGIVNPDITQTGINLMPVTLSLGIVEMVSVSTLLYLYKNTNTDKLIVNNYLSITDDYGNSEKHLFLSFMFDKKIANKINWDKFQFTKLPNVAADYKVSSWAMDTMSNEVSR